MTKKRTHLSGDVRREQILDAATALFIERGFESVKTADIAEQLDISRPHIYTYFASTEAVFEAALEKYSAAYLAELDEALKDDPLMAVTSTFELLLRHRELLLLLGSASHPLLSGQRDRVIEKLESHTSEFLGDLVTPERRERFGVLNLLLRTLLLDAASAVVAAPESYDAKVVGELVQVMVNAAFAEVVPEVTAHWQAGTAAKAKAADHSG